MLGDIDLNLKPHENVLTIHTPYKEEIGEIIINKQLLACTYTAKFNNIDELDLKIPYNVFNDDFKLVKNPYWDYFKGDYLLKLSSQNSEKYFIITNNTNTWQDGKDYKELKCYSYEYVLSKKKIRGLKDTLMLYDSTGISGVLNLLEKNTSWRIGYVDNDTIQENVEAQIHAKYRTFDISEKTWLEFLMDDVKNAYDCIFKFNTLTKTIDVYASQNIGEDNGLYVSNYNFLTNFQGQEKFEEIITRLSVYGSNNISISRYNPLGTVYIEDFSYYLNNHYMTSSLEQALINYNNLVNSHKGDFNTYLTQLTELENTLITKETELSNLQLQLKQIQDQEYVTISAGQQALNSVDLSTLKTQETTKQTEINSKQTEIDDINNQITTVNNNVKSLQTSISKENNFTKEQLSELDDYIHESTWQNSNITDENELYQKGLEAMNKINVPSIEYSNIGVADFLKIIKFQHYWNKLSLGDFIWINYDKFGSDIQLRLVGYQQDFINNKLTLDLSNKLLKDDVVRYISDMLSNTVQTSTSVNMSKFIWDKSETNSQTLDELISSDLNAAKNAVLSGVNNEVRIDGHGINLKNMSNSNEQLRILSNILAMTTDSWNTVDYAVTPQGVIAKNLIGKAIASEKLTIENSSASLLIDKDKLQAHNMILSLDTDSGNGKIYIDPTVGIKIQNNSSGSWKDVFYADDVGDLTMDGRLKITENGITLFDIWKNNNGGLLTLYDINGTKNATIGSESGVSANIGGTLVLFNDNEQQRVGIGILANEDAGIANLLDNNGIIRASMYANATWQGGVSGAGISIFDSSGIEISYIKETQGKINGEIIATRDWVLEQIASLS